MTLPTSSSPPLTPSRALAGDFADATRAAPARGKPYLIDANTL
jgi:hypothetical protein